MILFFDDAAELSLQATAGIHQAAAVLAEAGHQVRVVDLFCALSEVELRQLAQNAELVVIHSNSARPAAVYQQACLLRQLLPHPVPVLLAGWCSGLLSTIPVDSWLSVVSGIYSDGPRIALFLQGILAGALNLSGSRKIWGGDATAGDVPAQLVCPVGGYPWRVRTITWESPLCDSVCGKCTYARCLREEYTAYSADHLAPALTRVAHAGTRYVLLDDQTTPHTALKLQSLARITQAHPQLTWLLRLDGAELLRTPAILKALADIPVAALAVSLPAMAESSLSGLSLPGNIDDLLVALRKQTGPDCVLLAAGYCGYATDSANTMSAAIKRATSWFDAGLVDTFCFEVAFLGNASPVMRSGAYRFPVPGRLTGQYQPYWESDSSNSDELAQLCREGNHTWQDKGCLHAQCRQLEQVAQLLELGVAPTILRKALRDTPARQERYATQIAAARTSFIRRYREQL